MVPSGLKYPPLYLRTKDPSLVSGCRINVMFCLPRLNELILWNSHGIVLETFLGIDFIFFLVICHRMPLTTSFKTHPIQGYPFSLCIFSYYLHPSPGNPLYHKCLAHYRHSVNACSITLWVGFS